MSKAEQLTNAVRALAQVQIHTLELIAKVGAGAVGSKVRGEAQVRIEQCAEILERLDSGTESQDKASEDAPKPNKSGKAKKAKDAESGEEE